MHLRPARARGFTLVELMTVLVILTLVATIMLPRFWMARDRSAYTACGQNLRNVAVSLQAYANDNHQGYPTSLSMLVPGYMGSLPRCPEAGGVDTYGSTYARCDAPMNFTLFCRGTYHVGTAGVSVDMPLYSFDGGLR